MLLYLNISSFCFFKITKCLVLCSPLYSSDMTVNLVSMSLVLLLINYVKRW